MTDLLHITFLTHYNCNAMQFILVIQIRNAISNDLSEYLGRVVHIWNVIWLMKAKSRYVYTVQALGGGGVLRKKKLTGCAAPVFDQIPLAKELLVENIPLAKVSFLIMSPFLQDFKEFQPKYSHFKSNFPKIDANLAPECKFLGVLVKNIPLAKDLERKIYPWR